MLSKLKSFIKEFKTPSILLVSILFLSFLVFIFIFYNSGSRLIMRNLKSIGKDFNEINNSLGNGVKGLSIDTTKSTELLESGSDSLRKLVNNLSEINDTDSNTSELKTNLNNSLSNTIDLYNYCLYIIKNPNEIKSNINLEQFALYKDNCFKSYNVLKSYNINIFFSDKTLCFLEYTYNYANTIIKVNRDSDIQNVKQREFILLLQSFDKSIESLNEDLIPAIEKIREEKRDIQVIIDDLSKKELLFNNMKKQSYNLSVPSGYMKYYTNLEEYFKMYETYLKSIKEATIFEKTCSDKNKYKNSIDKLYSNALSKRQDTLDSYSNYKNLFTP